MISTQFLVTTLVVVLIPGTGVVFTLATGLGWGRRAALWASLGCTLGIVPHLLAATLGVAALLHSSAVLFQILKWAGVAYLLWLAWQALRQDGALNITTANPAARTHQNGLRIARRAALLNLLNPKLSIFFLALLPPFLSGTPHTATAEMLVLGGVFMALTFVIFALYGLCAAQARTLFMTNTRAMLWLNRSFAGLLALIAGRLAAERS